MVLRGLLGAGARGEPAAETGGGVEERGVCRQGDGERFSRAAQIKIGRAHV